MSCQIQFSLLATQTATGEESFDLCQHSRDLDSYHNTSIRFLSSEFASVLVQLGKHMESCHFKAKLSHYRCCIKPIEIDSLNVISLPKDRISLIRKSIFDHDWRFKITCPEHQNPYTIFERARSELAAEALGREATPVSYGTYRARLFQGLANLREPSYEPYEYLSENFTLDFHVETYDPYSPHQFNAKYLKHQIQQYTSDPVELEEINDTEHDACGIKFKLTVGQETRFLIWPKSVIPSTKEAPYIWREDIGCVQLHS
jgi:hypothetical protein